MPTRMVGRKFRIGPVWIPRIPPSQPHWKIATTAPKAANSDRMNPPVAINGTKIDRKTTTMMSSESPTTSAR